MNILNLVKTMQYEKSKNIRSGIYGLTQKEMAYNSNKIEGSRLTKDHTASLFDTGSIYVEGEYRAKDVEEATGHFVMFNKMLDTLEVPLDTFLMKEFHKALKQGVFEDIANGYAIGDFKTRRNYVGTVETALPDEVPERIDNLLKEYENEKNVTLMTLAEFHLKYERIHPFQDGNGRTGRIILFRECIVHDIVPFIIRDENKARYVKALADQNVKALHDYFMEEQSWYEEKTLGTIIDFTTADNANNEPNHKSLLNECTHIPRKGR